MRERRTTSVVLLELNELCPSLMSRFMAEGVLPNFRRLHDESVVFVTDAGEAPPNLEPWIQWVTVHSGMPFAEHQIFHLGDGARLAQPCIWDVLSDRGLPVWICGSMNVRYAPTLRGAVLPDPWSAQDAHPKELATFHRFVQRHVLEHTSDRVALGLRDQARFAAFMARHGVSAGSLAAIARQLLEERIRGAGRWKRAVIQDKLQLDVFRAYHRRHRPVFSTFFANSTAHFQHVYWRNMDPDGFSIRPSAADQAEYAQAIRFGYREMDRLVGSLLELCDEGTTVVLATALSQQPCVAYETTGGKAFSRARDVPRLLRFAGVSGAPAIAPVMAQDFHLRFGSEAEALSADERLRALRVAGRPAMNVERDGATLLAGPTRSGDIGDDAVLSIDQGSASMPFFEMFHRVEGLKSGMHHPDGILWFRTPERRHAVHGTKVGLTAIAPTVLELLGVPRPTSMRDEPLPEVTGDAPGGELHGGAPKGYNGAARIKGTARCCT